MVLVDERVAALKDRLGLDLDPDNYLPIPPEVRESWRPKSTGFNVEVASFLRAARVRIGTD